MNLLRVILPAKKAIHMFFNGKTEKNSLKVHLPIEQLLLTRGQKIRIKNTVIISNEKFLISIILLATISQLKCD